MCILKPPLQASSQKEALLFPAKCWPGCVCSPWCAGGAGGGHLALLSAWGQRTVPSTRAHEERARCSLLSAWACPQHKPAPIWQRAQCLLTRASGEQIREDFLAAALALLCLPSLALWAAAVPVLTTSTALRSPPRRIPKAGSLSSYPSRF